MSSKRRIRRKACDGKQKFSSRKTALDTALHVKRRTGDQGYVQAYRCRFCSQFHWGHT